MAFFNDQDRVIDLNYVIPSVDFGHHATSGGKLDPVLKGTLVKIHAEPIIEERNLRVDKLPITVNLPMVTVQHETLGQPIYRVVYDPRFVVRKGHDSQKIIDLVALRGPRYDPFTRD